MCQTDHAEVAAMITSLAAAHPRIAQRSHPALAGCDDVAWSAIPRCPENVPLVLRGLLVPDAAGEAQRLLSFVVLAGPLQHSPAMPAVLPFLLRLAADPLVPHRERLFDVVVLAAVMSKPGGPPVMFGPEEERAACRAVLAAHSDQVSRLLADPVLTAGSELGEDERADLVTTAGL